MCLPVYSAVENIIPDERTSTGVIEKGLPSGHLSSLFVSFAGQKQIAIKQHFV
jgi:hypothetical protein